MKHYVGLDISMKETFICIEDEMGEIIAEGKKKTEPEAIAEYIKKFGVHIEKVGLESGSLSHFLVRELSRLGLPVCCIDARKMAAVLSVQINKTDKNDARGIAKAMRCGLYTEVVPKSQEALEVGTLLSSRRLLVNQKVAVTSTIRGLLKTYGIRLGPCGEKGFSEAVRKHFKSELGRAIEGIESLLKQQEMLVEEIKILTKKLEQIARENEQVVRLMTIPGIGAITALNYVVEIGNPKRFKKSRTVGAYFGMTPKQYSSGESVKQGRISKYGSSEVRSLLNEAAIVLLTRTRNWSRLKAWGLKIYRKHGFKKACMAVGRKLAVIMHRMMVTETRFIYGEQKATSSSKAMKKPLPNNAGIAQTRCIA